MLVRVFSGTRAREREALGERATAWLRANPGWEPRRAEVRQSSDRGFHCLTIVLFLAPSAGDPSTSTAPPAPSSSVPPASSPPAGTAPRS